MENRAEAMPGDSLEPSIVMQSSAQRWSSGQPRSFPWGGLVTTEPGEGEEAPDLNTSTAGLSPGDNSMDRVNLSIKTKFKVFPPELEFP